MQTNRAYLPSNPRHCDTCNLLRERTRKRARLRFVSSIQIKTWCRICGMPVLLELLPDYEAAVEACAEIDATPMRHERHEEYGGWGVHWRLDEVLAVVFPQHENDIFFMPPDYNHMSALDCHVQVLLSSEKVKYEGSEEDRRRRLSREINGSPKTREDLELCYGRVWDSDELKRDFEVIGFRAPFAVVREKRWSGVKGSLLFQNEPRYYFDFKADRIL